MRKKSLIKPLCLALACVLPTLTTSVFAGGTSTTSSDTSTNLLTTIAAKQSGRDKALNQLLGKIGAREGLVRTDKQVYYVGDSITLKVILPTSLRALLTSEAEAQVLMYLPSGDVVSFPVQDSGDGVLFESVIDNASTLPAGVYQLALVLVNPNGDATSLTDWYNGFSGLVSVTRVKISEQTSTDVEDMNSDGMIDGDTDGNGFVDEVTSDEDSSELENTLNELNE